MPGKTAAVQVTGFPRQYKKPVFVVDFEGEERKSSPRTHFSLALSELTGCKALLLVPESLAVGLAGSADELEEMARDEKRLQERFLEELGVYEDVEVKVIPSTGSFSSRDGLEARYETDFDLIQASVFAVFLDLLDEGHDVILDVSSGLNVYPTIAVRALYDAATHLALRSLYRLLIGEQVTQRLQIASYGQVISDGEEVRVRFEGVEPQLSKEFPLTSDDISRLNNELKWFRKLDMTYVKYVRRAVTEGFRAFNCLVLNTPLPLYVSEPKEVVCLLDEGEVLELEMRLRGAVGELVRSKRIERVGSKVTVVRETGIRFRSLARMLGALAATSSLMRMISVLRESVRNGWVPLSSLRQFFLERVYKNGGYRSWFALNEYLLEIELNRVGELAEKAQPGKPSLLKDILQTGGSSDVKRNFFAHSGFLADATEVMKDEAGEVWVRYSQSAPEGFKPRDWLAPPRSGGA